MADVSGATEPTRNTAMFLDPVGLGDQLNATWGYRKLKLPLILL